MAIWTKYSGTLVTSNKYLNYRIGLTLNSQNIASNTSNVTVFIQAWRTNTGYTTNGTGTAYCTINGTAYSQAIASTQKITYNSYTQLFSQTLNISHDANGVKTLAMSGYISIPGAGLSSSSQSASIALNTIPRYTSITAFSATVRERNRIDIGWSAANTCNYWWYSLNGGSTWVAVGAINASSGSIAITGLAAGTGYSLRVRVRRSDSNLTTDSGILSRTTLAIAAPNAPTLRGRTCTSINVAWTSNRTVIRAQLSLNGGGWQSAYASNFGATTAGHFNITGLAPNTTYGIRIRVLDAVHTGSWSGASATTNMATIRLTTAGAPTFSTGNSFTVALSRGSTSVSNDVTLQMWADSQKYIDIATTTQWLDTVTFNLTEAQLNTIYSNRIGSTNSTVRLKIVNRWGHGGAIQGTSYSAEGKVTIANASPTLDGVSYIDSSTTVQTLLNDNQKILRNLSTLQVTAGQATSQKYATLKSYKVSIGGGEYTLNTSGTSETGKVVNVGKVNQSANQTAVLTVTDSRGYTATKSFTVQMLDYLPPQFIRASADRLNSYEEEATLNVESRRAIVRPLDSDINEIEMRYRIKENPSGVYGGYVDLTSSSSSTFDLWKSFTTSQYMADYPNNKSYTVELGIKDKFTDWSNTLITLPEGIALLRFLQDRVEVGNDLRINNGKDLYLQAGKDHPEDPGDVIFLDEAAEELARIWVLGDDLNFRNSLQETYKVWHTGNTIIGSNPNGTYVRFQNGLQLCWTSFQQAFTWASASNKPASGYEPWTSIYTWTFPATFDSSASYHVSGGLSWASSAYAGAIARQHGWTSSGNRSSVFCALQFEHWWNYTGTTARANLFAIGRWK